MELEEMLSHTDARTLNHLNTLSPNMLDSYGFDANDGLRPVTVESGDTTIGEDAHSAQIYLVEFEIPRKIAVNGVKTIGSRTLDDTTPDADREYLTAPILIKPHWRVKKSADERTGKGAVYANPRPQVLGTLTPDSTIVRYEGTGQIANVTNVATLGQALGAWYDQNETVSVPYISSSRGGGPSWVDEPLVKIIMNGPSIYAQGTAELMNADRLSFKKAMEADLGSFPTYAGGFDRVDIE